MAKQRFVEGYNRLPDGRSIWMIQADDNAGWNWSEFFDHPAHAQEVGRSWGGPDWIRSAPSAKRIRDEFRDGDVAVCYQAAGAREVVGLVRIASRGYSEGRRGEETFFDIDWGCRVQPIPWDSLRTHPTLSAMEKVRTRQGTVFRVSRRN